MKKSFIIIAFFALILTVSADYHEVLTEDSVVVIKDATFDGIVKKYDYILVDFYAPWCGHCKQLAPEFAKASQKLRQEDSSIHLGKVDATIETALAEKYAITAYPTLKLFNSATPDKPLDFTGGRSADEIIDWLKRRTGPPSVQITEMDELEKLIGDNDVSIVYFGDSKSEKFKLFNQIATEFEDVTFGHTASKNILDKYQTKDDGAIILFKHIGESKIALKSSWTEDSLRKFINEHEYPIVLNFDNKIAARIFEGNLQTLFLLRDNDQQGQNAEDTLKLAAPKIKDRITIAIANLEEPLSKRLAEFIEVNPKDLPAIRIVVPDDNQKKYVFDGPILEDHIIKFVEDFTNSNLKPRYKSEELPETNEDPVKIVVGKTFKSIVLDEEYDVLVEFYAPWCGHCKNLAPIYEKLAKKLANRKDLIIAKMDATSNEVESLTVETFPTIIFYPKNKKSSPIYYDSERDEKSFIDFLKKHSTSWKEEEIKEETMKKTGEL